jgi:succinate dehydrogenase / fumarate reductase flavoprotein subunit
MGGIPTDIDGRVFANEKGDIIKGFYAAGECACVSVHGGNRLGTNSLLDIIIFGRRSGKAVAEFIKTADYSPLPENTEEQTRKEIEALKTSTGKESILNIRTELQVMMMNKCGVFRNEKELKEGIEELKQLKERYKNISIQDKGNIFNTDLMEAIELGNLLDSAEATLYSAENRQESRGAHTREDYTNRDDENWMKHTFITKANGSEPKITYKPVVITRYKPMERKY